MPPDYRLLDYRLAVEKEYCEWIVQRLKERQEDLSVEALVLNLPNDRRKVLDQQLSRYNIDKYLQTSRSTASWLDPASMSPTVVNILL